MHTTTPSRLLRTLVFSVSLILILGCQSDSDLLSAQDAERGVVPVAGVTATTPVLAESLLVSGLRSPVGVETAPILRGVLIAEAGTGTDDGQVTLYRQGATSVLIENFPSNVRPDGNVEGTTHLVVRKGILWIVNGFAGRLYRYDLRSYHPGQAPVDASTLPSQDIRAFLFAQGFTDSNLYDLVFDGFGNAYITDSGANVVVKRRPGGALSVFTSIPRLTNPAPIGDPTIEPVPTGIAFNRSSFFVTAFGGFPFAPGTSTVFKIDRSGTIVDSLDGFDTLIEAEFSQPVPRTLFALQLGTFGETGFVPNSGAVLKVTPSGPEVLLDGLNVPNGLEAIQGRFRTRFLVTSIADGTLTAYVVRTRDVV